MYVVLFLIVFAFGVSIGSFITALVPRLKHKQKFVNDRSECPHCKHKLSAIELIPLLSFIIQGAKCKHCGKKIAEFYPLVEIFTGILFVVSLIRFIDRVDIFSTASIVENLLISILVGLFLSVFIFFAAYDYLYQEVPDNASLPFIVLLILANIALLFIAGFDVNASVDIAGIQIFPLMNLIFGFVAAFFITLLVVATNGRGMGGGDIRIAALLGLISSWKGTLVGLYVAFITGSVLGLIIAIKKGQLKGLKLPFVPFLSLGAILGFLFPNEIFSLIFPLL